MAEFENKRSAQKLNYYLQKTKLSVTQLAPINIRQVYMIMLRLLLG